MIYSTTAGKGAMGHRFGDWIMRQAEKYFGKKFSIELKPTRHYVPMLIRVSFGLSNVTTLGLKTVVEDEEDLVQHANQNKALIFAFSPHDMVSAHIIWCRDNMPDKFCKTR